MARLMKKNSLLSMINGMVIDLPAPVNISYLWNFGSLLGVCLVVQILTGVFLAMHYAAHVNLAFSSVEHIMRDVNYGWLLRYIHANGASMFFICVYIHIARGLYYGSYTKPRVILWTVGVVIFFMMFATAFIGYMAKNGYHNNSSVTNINEHNEWDRIIKKLGQKPKRVYLNLHNRDTQLKIIEENRHKSGIYMIFNIINDKCYIGSAASNRINVRFRNHCIHGTGARLTHEAIKKYGLESFAFVIIEYYPGFILKESLKGAHIQLLDLETKWIQKVQPEYNILEIAGSSLGFQHSQETRIKMKDNYSEKRREACRNINLNKKFSLERRALLSQIALLRNQNLELKAKLSRLSSKPVNLYNLDGTIHSRYSGIRVMAKHFGCCNKTINKAIKNQTIFRNIGYIKLDQ